jgi:hypothetical protein
MRSVGQATVALRMHSYTAVPLIAHSHRSSQEEAVSALGKARRIATSRSSNHTYSPDFFPWNLKVGGSAYVTPTRSAD